MVFCSRSAIHASPAVGESPRVPGGGGGHGRRPAVTKKGTRVGWPGGLRRWRAELCWWVNTQRHMSLRCRSVSCSDTLPFPGADLFFPSTERRKCALETCHPQTTSGKGFPGPLCSGPGHCWGPLSCGHSVWLRSRLQEGSGQCALGEGTEWGREQRGQRPGDGKTQDASVGGQLTG